MRIVVVEINNIIEFPPVVTLIRTLSRQGHEVILISRGINLLPAEVLKSKIEFHELGVDDQKKGILGIAEKLQLIRLTKKTVEECMVGADVLWTTSANTLKALRGHVNKYKNVMQLMELVDELFLYHGHFRLSIKKIAQKSWKIVVPEINRAFIEQSWWGLDTLPYVLPNKPFDLNCGELSADALAAIELMKKDKRKKIIYLGGIWPDRDLSGFAETIKNMSDYALYIVGKAYGIGEKHLKILVNKYDAIYLGEYKAPQHLAFLNYARIGLLPYKASKSFDVSPLNALYCAPNKIYEYSGFGIPMIGSYVPGLIMPFEKYNIGYCCDSDNLEMIEYAIQQIDANYEVMSNNCKRFYDATDTDHIVSDILAI
nr:hypothetical protein [uncultured Butyrivibrio sp.]